MNNQFQLQHEHAAQTVAPQFLQHPAATPAGPTQYSYMSQPTAVPAPPGLQMPPQLNQQQQQWMTYQILPTGQAMTIANGTGPKRFFTTTAAATPTSHPNTIQITNSYTQQQLTPPKQPPTAVVKGNNIRIISTAPNVYSLNKPAAEQIFTPTSTTAADLYAPVTSSTLQSFYLPDSRTAAGNNMNRLVTSSNNTAKILPTQQVTGTLQAQPPLGINICINNHYAEPGTPANLCSALGAQSQQQASPIIPAIQHKALIPLIDSSSVDSSSVDSISADSSSGSTSTPSAVIIIDEPDSTTTTPHTPPTTPEAISSPLKSPIVVISPLAPATMLKSSAQLNQSFANGAPSIEAVPLLPPTPPSPSSALTSYELQEDVFIKCNDGRFYLGTIIDYSHNQYLVRFDDKSEQWCESEKLRKLGGSSNTQTTNTATNGPMCVACKQAQHDDVVEICERCGRGYHRGCTTEISEGSGIWCCKRCAKPMKMQQPLSNVEKPMGICRQLPYNADKLSWDVKHRVNEEKIYCYCGKPGRFDNNMLQCCKCRNWFHTQCMQDFEQRLLRGDSFFVFCCTICNDGKEFIRRLQIDWVDVLHITLYNLRKNQHHRYFHILEDIWPFVLEKRHQMPICAEWQALPETALMERIKQTLKDNPKRFACGRDTKHAPSIYALRHNEPPITPKVVLLQHEVINDDLLVNKLNLRLMPPVSNSEAKSKTDIYEFHTDGEEETAEVDQETSEDELPIKQIIERAKIQNKPEQLPTGVKRALDMADDNANDGQPIKLAAPAPVAVQPVVYVTSSRKRKAFRVSKSYKDIASKSNDSIRNCELSSDDNSSSSRGTSSLDLIIPPPANFLGRNNPFLMTTPKKNAGATVTQLRSRCGASGVAGIINSIFKMKSSSATSLFPKLSTTQLAKAAAQPRMVRTIKRRLSAKDIMIGPNQEVRRRRTRRLTTAVEVINTTTINPIPSHYFPIYAKDLPVSQPQLQPSTAVVKLLPPEKPTHGRLLRQRPRKSHDSPGNSRRSSTSSTATNGSSSLSNNATSGGSNSSSINDLKQSVNKYFGGAINRIDAGESFAIRAKRRTSNGHVQYLVEWGGDMTATTNGNINI